MNRVTDRVPGTPDGMQQRRFETLVDLAAQPRNMDVDHVGLGIEVVLVDVLIVLSGLDQ